MTPQKALEVLKHQRSIMPDNHQTAQALNIAIEVMERTNMNIMDFLAICAKGKDAGLATDMTVADVLMSLNSLNRDKPDEK